MLQDLSLVEGDPDVGHCPQIIVDSADIKWWQEAATATDGTVAIPTDLILLGLLVPRGGKLNLDILEGPRSPLSLIFDIWDYRLDISNNHKLILIKLSISTAEIVLLKVEGRCFQGLHSPSSEDRNLDILEVGMPMSPGMLLLAMNALSR